MKWLDLTLPTPAENLACDEALLDAAEAGDGGEVLRFWEPREHFVVVGYANRVATEVNRAACDARGIPVLRRCSGGGAVLQGPGCLNYSLVLPITGAGPLHSIASANRFIMETNRAALQTLPASPSLHVRGCTDLAVAGRKVSGNSQRRRKSFLLFHGTFLLAFDLSLIGEVLSMPSRQPDYRQGRGHGDFVANLGADAASVKSALRRAWRARTMAGDFPRQAVASLTRDKYVTNEWNFKF